MQFFKQIFTLLKFFNKSRKIYKDNNIIIKEIKPNKDKIYDYLKLDKNEIYKKKLNINYYILYIYTMKK